MSFDIEFPNEETMNVEDLNKLNKDLFTIYKKRNFSDKTEILKLAKCLAKIKGYILVADRKNIKEYFIKFYNLDFIELFNNLFDLKIESISFKILETLYYFITNIKNKEFLEYLYKKKFQANIINVPNIKMNLIDKLISLNPLKNEEFLTYLINFIKSLTLQINIDTLNYFYDSNINLFPILNKSFSLYNHSDPLIRNVVKNIFLTILKIEDNNLRKFLTAFPVNLYYTNIIFELKNTIIKLCFIDFSQNTLKMNYNLIRKYHDLIYETFLYLSDLLLINIESINYILINCLLNEIVLPLINSIVNYKNQEYVTIYHSLYILSLILYTIHNEFFYNVITFFLFRKEVSKSLIEKISSFIINKIDEKTMKIINIFLLKSQDADVNDNNWKQISKMMKKANGIDLSNGEIDIENIYDYTKNLMAVNNEQVKNPFNEKICLFFLCNDDSIILYLNLIINSCINYYKSIKKENNEYNILNNQYFLIDLNKNDSENIFNQLFKYLESSKDFRLATNEIILYNIQTFIKIFLKINKDKDNEKTKKIFGKRLFKLLEKQIKEINKKLDKDSSSIKYLFDNTEKAYSYYVKKMENKIKDLATLSNTLIPLVYLDKINDIPIPLREDKCDQDYIKNYMMKIYFINDIINDLFDNKKDIIKNKKFPLEIDTFKLTLGKEYKLEELGEDCYHCKIYKNCNYVNSEAIFSVDSIYFGEIIGQNFEDLSRIKIFKKIPLRYLEIKRTNEKCLLDIFDKTNENTSKNVIQMNAINEENTKIMHSFFLQKLFNCQLLVQSLYKSFIDDITKNLKKLVLDEE